MKSKTLNNILNVVLFSLIVVLIVLLNVKTDKDNDRNLSAAADSNLLVANSSNVSIYVSGNHIDNLQSSEYNKFGDISLFFSEYYSPVDNEVTITAISENKVFTNWTIFDSANPNVDICTSLGIDSNRKTYERITFKYPNNLTGKLVIIANYKTNIAASDYGKYFFDPYFIEEAEDFEALARIVNNDSPSAEDYAVFKSVPADRPKLLKGYFKITKSLTLNDTFISIGSLANPFYGKIDGSNNGESAIISLNQIFEIEDGGHTGNYFAGLFGAISEFDEHTATIVRNVKMQGIISIIEDQITGYQNAYIGGLAGISGHGVIVENCESKVDISVDAFNTNVYAGGFFGYSYSAIDQNRNLSVKAEHKNWSITTHSNTSNTGNIYLGGYAGYLANAYIYDFDVLADVFTSSANSMGYGNTYNGGIVGYMDHVSTSISNTIVFEDLSHVHFTNAHIICSDTISITGQSNNGNVYVGGLIGRLNTSSYECIIANISFEASTKHRSLIEADTRDSNSQGDVYLGGIVAYIDGEHTRYDEDYITDNEPIFRGNIDMEARQKGKSTNNIGKVVGGCFIGYGYIDINNNEIFLNCPDSSIELDVIQDKFSTSTANSIIFDHISAGIFAGSFGTRSLASFPIEDFVLICNNITVKGIREEGAKSYGEIAVGGLVGYANYLNISNCKFLYNNTNLFIESVSYEAHITTNFQNNAYLGGVVGCYNTPSGTKTSMATMSNTIVAGYEFPENDLYVYNEANLTTAVSEINGIQNTQAGGDNYRGELYVGGLVGMSNYANLTNCEYRGTSIDKNKIIYRGNNNVDSAMIGGLIGFVRSQAVSGTNVRIQHCKVNNVSVQAEASCTIRQDPDIYIGGVVGAVFLDANSDHRSVYIENCISSNNNIHGIGHQDMKSYAGGVVGGANWSDTLYVNNCISYNNRINSAVDIAVNSGRPADAFAGGIVGFSGMTNINIQSCASVNDVIEASINVTSEQTNTSDAIAGGIFGSRGGQGAPTIGNCYVNSTIRSAKSKYVIGHQESYNTGSGNTDYRNYYNQTNMAAESTYTATNNTTAVTFTDIINIAKNSSGNLYGGTTLDTDNNLPYTRTVMTHPSIFSSSVNSNVYSYSTGSNVGSSYANLWVKIIDNSSTEPSYENGWVRLGEQRLIMSGATGYKITSSFNEVNSDDYIITTNTIDNVTVKLNQQIHDLIFTMNIIDNSNDQLATNMAIDYNFYKNGTLINQSDVNMLGIFEFITNSDGTTTIIYKPTAEYTNSLQEQFTIEFTSGDAVKRVNFTIISNTIEIMQGIYSETTLPLNYHGKNDGKLVGQYTYGSKSDPYIYHDQTTIKIIPAIHRTNDGDIISDDSCKYVSYLAYRIDDEENESPVTIKPSGELEIGDVASGTKYRVQVTLYDKYNITNPKVSSSSVYITILDTITISTELKGANYDGPYALGNKLNDNNYNFIFNIVPKSGFAGIPEKLIISIGDDEVFDLEKGVDVSIDKYDVTTDLSGLIIKRLDNGEIITSSNGNLVTINWAMSDEGYQIIIPSTHIDGKVNIQAEFNPIYTMLFNINLDFEGIDDTNRYLTISATSDYTISQLLEAELKTRVVDGNMEYYYDMSNSVLNYFEQFAPFGYTLHGWYLIEDASFVASYGRSIEELLANFANHNNGEELFLNGNYTFYARWSFSIFLNEAPGTQIKCSFPETFLHKDKYNVDVPINNKKGFSFTIVKTDGFSGEADVNAHILIKEESDPLNDQYILRPVKIQKYHDDMYVYTVAPEDINGVLVITTFSSDSDFIVGEKEESVDESIVPEDGIFTIKYVVNHLEDNIYKRQTFAYANHNINLNKVLKLSFSKIIDEETGERTEYFLPTGTEIKLYYVLNQGETVVGYHKLTSPKSSIYDTDFKIINTNDNMFTTQTFAQFFGTQKSVSEGYYFVVTPPNGYDSNTINAETYLSCVATVGYVDETLGTTTYLEADRYTYNSTDANKPPYFDEMNQAPSRLLKDESKHESNFIVYNSRITDIEKTDSNMFSYYDLKHTINVNGVSHINPGDWRHQNKYFSLGIQVFTNDLIKQPINLAGLTINVYRNGILYDSQTVSYKLPKLTIYSLVEQGGEYYVEVLVDDQTVATQYSGFTDDTEYGVSISLLESTSNTKPGMGTIRNTIFISIIDMKAGKLWNNVDLSEIMFVTSPTEWKNKLPKKNALGNDIVWTYNEDDLNNDTDHNKLIDVIGTITIDGVNYNKSLKVTVPGNAQSVYDEFTKLLSFDDHMVNINSIHDGVIPHLSELKDIIEIPHSTYRLKVLSYVVDNSEQELIRDNVVYGWDGSNDDTITVTYIMLDELGNEVPVNNNVIVYTADKNGIALTIEQDPNVINAITGIDSYISEKSVGGSKSDIIVFTDHDLKLGLSNVEWQGAESDYLVNNLGELTIKELPTKSNGEKINSSEYTLFYNTNDGTNRTYSKDVNIYVAPKDIYNTTVNCSIPTDLSSTPIKDEQTIEYSVIIGDTGFKLQFSLNYGYTVSNKGNWTYNISYSRYQCSSKNSSITFVYSIKTKNIGSIDDISFGISSTNRLSNNPSPSIQNGDGEINITLTVTSANNASNSNRARFTFDTHSFNYDINWYRNMIESN